MWITRTALAAALALATASAAMAQPIEIATLGRAPLMGTSTNPGELQSNFKRNEALMRQAGSAIGLTREQYEQFRLALEVGKPNWVTVPRHLDAMTWASGGQVHVLHDVIIPANQKGVEVDLHSGDKIIALFLPARCGNLSVIRRTVPHVATRNFPVPHVAAVTAPQPCPAGMTGTTMPDCQQVAAVTAPPPCPAGMTGTTMPDCQQVAAVTPIVPPPPVHHGFSLLPLAAVLPFLIHGSTTPGTNTFVGSGTVVGPPPCP